jgi:hypothetical protein
MKSIVAVAATAIAVGLAAVPAPALAQQGASQSEVIVYGSDPCPRSTESNVVVCVHRPETERYRLPKNQQLLGTRQQRESWSNKSQTVMNAGKTGINSCSPVGPAGHTGCLIQEIQQARQESQEAADQNTPPPQ